MPWGLAAAAVGGVASAAATSAFSGGSSGGGGGGGASGMADPFAAQRPQYQTLLNSLINDPSSITSLPGYAFNMNQGLQAVQGSAAANGMLNSGNVLTALQKQGSAFSSGEYWNQLNELNLLSGANVGSPGTAGQIQAGQNLQNQQSASALGNQLGNLVGQGANSYFGSGGGGYSGGNPFAGSSGYGVGGNTYGFTAGQPSDGSWGVSGGMFGG